MCLLEQSKVKLRKYIELIRNSMKPTIKTIECGNKDNGVAPIKVVSYAVSFLKQSYLFTLFKQSSHWSGLKL